VSDRSHEQLEAERDFLLKSLDDLEAERAAGGIDDDSYRALHDDYTARAAAMIRNLRDGVDARPTAPATSWQRRGLVIGAIVAFAVIAGVTLALALGARLPGQTSSGNTDATTDRTPSAEAQRKRLEAAVAANPDDAASRLLLARFLEADDDLSGALEQYDAVIAVDADNAAAYAQSGRLLYLTAGQAPAADAALLVERAAERLDRSIELDSEYPDARFFRAIVRANEYGDFAGAQQDLQRYLVASPNGTFAAQARRLLADVTKALEPPGTTTTSPTGNPTGNPTGK
jgi:cytochrome c-type biogenesis protein CcmH/NrfG